jgi:hypothetical protein
MTLYSNPDHEVIYCILELLPTIDEALQHMVTQLDELRLEGAEVLLRDATQAISSISGNLVLLTTEHDEAVLVQSTSNIREAIGAIIDGFEASNLSLIHTALATRLIPAFNEWRQQVEMVLQPSVSS